MSVLRSYRPADRANLGHGVLVVYHLSPAHQLPAASRQSDARLLPQPPLPPLASPLASPFLPSGGGAVGGGGAVPPQAGIAISVGAIEAALGAVLRPADCPFRFEVSADVPVMDLGLDSLQLQELHAELEALSCARLPAAFLFDHPTARTALAALHVVTATHPASRAAASDAAAAAAAAAAATVAPTAALAPLRRSGCTRARIALVGVSCRTPGPGGDVQGFGRVLWGGTDAISLAPVGWQGHGGFFDPAQKPEGFDPAFFGICAAEARSMDPHQRLLLELAAEALHDSGIVPLDGASDRGAPAAAAAMRASGLHSAGGEGPASRWPQRPLDHSFAAGTATVVGLCNNEWSACVADSVAGGGGGAPYAGTGGAQSIAAGRLAYVSGLRGPSLVVDTACSSSLSALHVARGLLRTKECGRALLAAADLLLSPRAIAVRGAAGMLAPDGRCKTFDARADGYVRSEAGAAFVLVPQAEQAEEHEEHEQPGAAPDAAAGLAALLVGSALNQDGRTASLTAPSGRAQCAALAAALADAGLAAAAVGFVEAHGTGTQLGDPIEMGALLKAYGNRAGAPLVVGALKTNVGHAEGAAGALGLLKVVQALGRRAAPPNLHLVRLSPLLGLEGSAFPVLLPASCTPLAATFAGVSSFGFGGSNAHATLQAAAMPPLTAARAGRLSEALGGYRPQQYAWRHGARTPHGDFGAPVPRAGEVMEVAAVRGALVAAIGEVLSPGVASGLADSDDLLEAGVDSLSAIELAISINAIAQRLYSCAPHAPALAPLSAAHLLAHPTVAELQSYLFEHMRRQRFIDQRNPNRTAAVTAATATTPDTAAAPTAATEWDHGHQPLAITAPAAPATPVALAALAASAAAPAAATAATATTATTATGQWAASALQRGMIYHHLAEPGSNTFVESMVWQLSGPLDTAAFRAAWAAVAANTPALRSRFDVYAQPEPRQIVEAGVELPWAEEDMPAADAAQRVAAATTALRAKRARAASSLELGRAPLWSVRLLRFVAPAEATEDEGTAMGEPTGGTASGAVAQHHCLLLTMHHLVVDGWSLRLLVEAVQREYRQPGSTALSPTPEALRCMLRQCHPSCAAARPPVRTPRAASGCSAHQRGKPQPRSAAGEMPCSHHKPPRCRLHATGFGGTRATCARARLRRRAALAPRDGGLPGPCNPRGDTTTA